MSTKTIKIGLPYIEERKIDTEREMYSFDVFVEGYKKREDADSFAMFIFGEKSDAEMVIKTLNETLAGKIKHTLVSKVFPANTKYYVHMYFSEKEQRYVKSDFPGFQYRNFDDAKKDIERESRLLWSISNLNSRFDEETVKKIDLVNHDWKTPKIIEANLKED